jgi:sugar lactone lactonase YvrE
MPAPAQSIYSGDYTFTTLAGPHGIANTVELDDTGGVCVDTKGNIYEAETENSIIREISPAGVESTIAGLFGVYGCTDGVGSAALFNGPSGITSDSAGNLYVADNNIYTSWNPFYQAQFFTNEVRKISPVVTSTGTNWVVTTLIDFQALPYVGNIDFALTGVAVDGAGNVYVFCPTYNSIFVLLDQYHGEYSSFASLGVSLSNLVCSGVDSVGNFYVVDTVNGATQEIIFNGTNEPFLNPTVNTITNGLGTLSVTADYYGNIDVTVGNTIQELVPVGTNWVASAIVGSTNSGFADGTGTNALFNGPGIIGMDSASNLYVFDTGNNAIRTITSAGTAKILAYTASGPSSGSADGFGSDAQFNGPCGIAVDSGGNLYVADTGNDTIRTITSAGLVNILAGLQGVAGTNDGIGTYARFNGPCGVAVDSAGYVYVADTSNSTIRTISPYGSVYTLAGSPGVAGTNNGTGDLAQFVQPMGIALDSATNLYVAEGIGAIRKITFVGTNRLQSDNWLVTTITSTNNTFITQVGSYQGIAVDSATNLYVTDDFWQTIDKFTPAGINWNVHVFGYADPGDICGSSDSAGMSCNPTGIAVDGAGNLYVADTGNDVIREISPSGSFTTIAGLAQTHGDFDGLGIQTKFYSPRGIAADSAGDVYVADTGNNAIRKGILPAYVVVYGAANKVAYSQPAMNSSLTVWLQPTNANGQWRFPWEVAWHNSGYTETNLVAGNYPVEFSTVSGYLVIPFSGTVGVTNNTIVTNQYYPTSGTVNTNNSGTLTVNLGPNPPSGAGWGFLGEGPPTFPSNYSTNLVAGTYLITFAPVSGRVTPPNLSVQVQAGEPTYLSENYLLAQSAPSGVLLPTPVPSANISDLTDYPFGFNGQLETDVGYGSGVAVQANVVLTAAHLVFNDQNLSYVSQAYWYFQEETGVFQPQPIAARGWYVLSGYAAQRTIDMEVYPPGYYTPQAANLDVAAMYFLQYVAGGGYGGYLPSDASPNTWLTSTAEKMLVGYPVDGSEFGNAVVPGEMYQTQPQPDPLALSTDPVNGQQEVYIASWFLGYPGDSGGPVYVQYNGYYYPAGVYLATLYDGVTPYASAVRAIDSEVVNLITNAEVLGDSGTNNSGGGVITIIPNQAINAQNPGYVQLQLAPPAAVAAGAGWRLQGDTTYSTATNYTEAVLSTNAIGVQFKPIAGWNLPTNQTVTVYPQQIVTPVAFYTVSNPVMVANGNLGIGITGTTGTVYEVESRTSLTSGSWVPMSTNTITSSGFNLVLPKPGTNKTTTFYRVVWLGQ